MSDIYRYIETIDDGSLIFTESSVMLPKIKGRLLLSDSDFKKYTLHIKYINCCSLNENAELEVDSVKVLSRRVQRIMYDIDDKSAELRKLVQEAAIFDNKEVAREIALVIKSMNKFLDSDFSNITDVNDIEQITCPELQLDYEKHFTNKIYGI